MEHTTTVVIDGKGLGVLQQAARKLKEESVKKDKDGERKGYYRGKKLKPGVSQEFVDRVEALSTEDKRTLVVEMAKQADDCRTFLKDEDGKAGIAELEAKLELVKGPTQETIRHINNKTKFLIDRLKEVEPSKS